MLPEPPASDAPLRGLNPAAILGILGDRKRARPIIPGWEIESVLGEGGLGIVWRARRIADGTVAAVKVPRVSEIEHIERLEHEAATLRALVRPHIVRLLESGPLDDGGMFLAMEYIDGPALSHALPAAGFEPARAFDLFRQIAAAAHARAEGVIHRDLKPAYILLAPGGTVRVADFGLARPVHERVQQLSLTQTGLVAGTAEYLPPEAYRAGYVPGVKGDIYALGVILYELLTGAPPRAPGAPSPSSAAPTSGWTTSSTALSDKIFRTPYTDPAPSREDIEKKVMSYYRSKVDFRDHDRILKSEVFALLVSEADAARRDHRIVQMVGNESTPGGQDFDPFVIRSRTTLLVLREPPGAWMTIEHYARTVPDKGPMYIRKEKSNRDDLYSAPVREISPAEAAAWTQDFVTALTAVPGSKIRRSTSESAHLLLRHQQRRVAEPPQRAARLSAPRIHRLPPRRRARHSVHSAPCARRPALIHRAPLRRPPAHHLPSARRKRPHPLAGRPRFR